MQADPAILHKIQQAVNSPAFAGWGATQQLSVKDAIVRLGLREVGARAMVALTEGIRNRVREMLPSAADCPSRKVPNHRSRGIVASPCKTHSTHHFRLTAGTETVRSEHSFQRLKQTAI